MKMISNRTLQLICLAAVFLVVTGCSQPEAERNQQENETTTSFGNPGEMALVSLAHKQVKEGTEFLGESISDSSGEKRVCGLLSGNNGPKQYIFSTTTGMIIGPSPENWDKSCANGWPPGKGY